MANQPAIELRFRQRLLYERTAREWSQVHLSKLLKAKGVGVSSTAIAKIEAGTRTVSMAEAAAIADVFEVSLDTLLGRDRRPEADMLYTVRSAIATAQQASVQLSGIAEQLSERIAELGPLDGFGQRDAFTSAFQRALGGVDAANEALYPVWANPQSRAISEGQRALDIKLKQEKRGKR